MGFELFSPPSTEDFFNYIQDIINNDIFSTNIQISIVYHSWRARNLKVHNEQISSPYIIATSILNALQDVYIHFARRNWGTISPSGNLPSWYPPPVGWIKANFDCSFLAGEYASIGVIIRDHKGELLKAHGKRVLGTSIIDCEIMAAASVDTLMDELLLEAHGIILEGDSINACNFIKSKAHSRNKPIMPNFDFSFLLEFKNIVINFVERSYNRAADLCAKLARYGDFLFLQGHTLPNELVAILESDYG